MWELVDGVVVAGRSHLRADPLNLTRVVPA